MSPATEETHLSYSAAGVDDRAAEAGLRALLGWVDKTRAFRDGLGAAALDIGYFANVVDIGRGLGVAIATDTAGSKVLVAQMLGRYDTIGIDCVAMNVNDILCVGAEPLAFVDCISLERAGEELLEQIGKGLYEGARRARVAIVGGEIAQVADMVKGYKPGLGFDLAGTCIGVVALQEIILGESVKDGDALIGLRSSGIHSNGFTLARKALFEQARYAPDQVLPELGRPLGEELLEPTRIYVDETTALRDAGVRVKALAHITGNGGLLNATRVKAPVGFVVERLPEPPAIFEVIRGAGNVAVAEMFRVYNMGVGFTVVVDPADTDRALAAVRASGTPADLLGYAVRDAKRRVRIRPAGLVGEAGRFHKES